MKNVMKPAFILCIVSVITVSLLGLVYNITLEPIENQIKKNLEAAMKEVLPQADTFTEFQTDISESISIVKIYEGFNSGELVGYIIELEPDGYGDKINMIMGLSSVDEIVTGVRILKHQETPGLGALAVKESFYHQYDGKNLVPLKVVKTSPGESEIDAITGATITTRAITGSVNEGIDWFNSFRDKAIEKQ